MIHISEDLTSTTNPLSNSTTHPQVVVSDSKPNTSRIFYPSQQECGLTCPGDSKQHVCPSPTGFITVRSRQSFRLDQSSPACLYNIGRRWKRFPDSECKHSTGFRVQRWGSGVSSWLPPLIGWVRQGQPPHLCASQFPRPTDWLGETGAAPSSLCILVPPKDRCSQSCPSSREKPQ